MRATVTNHGCDVINRAVNGRPQLRPPVTFETRNCIGRSAASFSMTSVALYNFVTTCMAPAPPFVLSCSFVPMRTVYIIHEQMSRDD